VTDERNLTGVWHGLYTYPHQKSVSFVATLIETERSLSGSTHEPCVYGETPGVTLFATLAGSRSGTAVSFVKTYDPSAGESFRSVNYDGMLSADATEIEGRWSIPGVWSGNFLMIRSVGKTAIQTRGILARV
jgi:hypothetical protein